MRMYETIVTRLKSVGTDAASGEPDERAATALLSFNQRRKIHIHVPENLRLEGHSIDCRRIGLARPSQRSKGKPRRYSPSTVEKRGRLRDTRKRKLATSTGDWG